MSASSVKSLPLIILAVMVSAPACSSNDGRLTGGERPAPLGGAASATPAAPPRTSTRDLNEQLFRRLDKVLTGEAGDVESPEDLVPVTSLLDQGADVDTRNSAGQTPPLVAAQNRHVKAMEVLLDRRADVNARDDRGRTALMAAAAVDDVKMVKLLLSKGAKVNIKD